MALGISSDWDDWADYTPPRRNKDVTDRELHALVNAVREAEHALTDANNALWGIFGYGPAQKEERDRKIRSANRSIERAIKTLDKIKDIK